MPFPTDETVGDVEDSLVKVPTTISPDAPISEVIRLVRTDPESRMVYVVDDRRRLLGTISWRDILRVTKARMGARRPGVFALVRLFRDLMPETARQLMRAPTPVTKQTPLAQALLMMEETHQNDLPIVDDEKRIVGELNGMHIMDVALRVFRQTEQDIARERSAAAPREPDGSSG